MVSLRHSISAVSAAAFQQQTNYVDRCKSSNCKNDFVKTVDGKRELCIYVC